MLKILQSRSILANRVVSNFARGYRSRYSNIQLCSKEKLPCSVIISHKNYNLQPINIRKYSIEKGSIKPEDQLSKKEKLKKAIKDYGATVLVFHISISLISLGTCYLLVSTGLDVQRLLNSVGLSEWLENKSIAANAGTFAVAYAVHKVFAPVRISITLGSLPFLVRYLRKLGILKK